MQYEGLGTVNDLMSVADQGIGDSMADNFASLYAAYAYSTPL